MLRPVMTASESQKGFVVGKRGAVAGADMGYPNMSVDVGVKDMTWLCVGVLTTR